MTITDRIIEAVRESKYKSNTALAKDVGVSKQTLGDWLIGRSTFIRPEHLIRLADTLGIEVRWLVTGRGPKYVAAKMDQDILVATNILASLPTELTTAS